MENFADLLTAVQNGDTQAFTQLEAVCRHHLYPFFYRDDDAYQEALIEIWQSLKDGLSLPEAIKRAATLSKTRQLDISLPHISLQMRIFTRGEKARELGDTIAADCATRRLDLIVDETYGIEEPPRIQKHRERHITLPPDGFEADYEIWKAQQAQNALDAMESLERPERLQADKEQWKQQRGQRSWDRRASVAQRASTDAGVVFYKRLGKWQAYFHYENRHRFIGYFATKQEALEARRKAMADPIAAITAVAQRKADRKAKPAKPPRRIITGVRQIANRFEVCMGRGVCRHFATEAEAIRVRKQWERRHGMKDNRTYLTKRYSMPTPTLYVSPVFDFVTGSTPRAVTVYTVPANSIFVFDAIDVVTTSETTPGTDPVITIGTTGNSTQYETTHSQGTYVGLSEAPLLKQSAAAGVSIIATVTANSTATAQSGIVTLRGYLIPATGAIVNPPGPPADNAFVAYCYTTDPAGNAVPSVSVQYALICPPTGDGEIYDATPYTLTSDNTGLLEIPMEPGATYKIWESYNAFVIVTIPSDATSPYALPNFTFIR